VVFAFSAVCGTFPRVAMHDFIYKNKRLIQVVLAIIFLPFAFVGVDSYFRSTDASVGVATVAGYRITQQEFNRALRERQEAIQRAAQGRAGPELLDSAELRISVLETLIRQRTLLTRAEKAGLVVTDDQLQRVITEIPAFQDDGKFSLKLYEQSLRAQGMTAAMFENKLRRDLLLQMLDQAIGGTAISSRIVAERVARLSEQQREVSHFTVRAADFVAEVKLDADAAKKYYDAHASEFRIPEQVRVEYVTLALDAFMGDVSIDAAEVQKYYEANRSRYGTPEERQASHILIAVDAAGDAEARKKARAKADDIYQQVKKQPERFAELARQFSEDPGSAQKGGDIGYFHKGTMLKAFDDAVFQMKVGEISAPIETTFGFHIIRLDGVRGGQVRSLEEVRAEIEAEFRKQRASRRFAEVAETFNNAVFEQSETLKPAAEIARSPVRQSGWISREAAPGELNHPKLLQAIFSEDVIRNKRNTEAVEVSPGVLMAARVIEHKPSAARPFEEVSAEIVKKLTGQQAAQLAAQSGRERLERLRQGKEAAVKWSTPQLVGRTDAKGLGEAAQAQAFRVDAGKLPAYAGVEDGQGGFTLIRVTRVVESEKIAPERQKAIAQALRELEAQQEMAAYVSSLKQKADIKISKEALEKK
jgi:peptidyl-prolyl cis-trans isomerase D